MDLYLYVLSYAHTDASTLKDMITTGLLSLEIQPKVKRQYSGTYALCEFGETQNARKHLIGLI